MKKTLIFAFALTLMAMTSCGSAEEQSTEIKQEPVQSVAEPAEDVSESESTAESTAEPQTDESSGLSESEDTPDEKEEEDEDELKNPHMSREPDGENSLAVDEGGCKKPTDPAVIYYINDEGDINAVKEIVCRTVNEAQEIPEDDLDFYVGGVHPNFSFEQDGVVYEVYLAPAAEADVEINGKYYNISDSDEENLHRLVYPGIDDDDLITFTEVGEDDMPTYYYYGDDGEKVYFTYDENAEMVIIE